MPHRDPLRPRFGFGFEARFLFQPTPTQLCQTRWQICTVEDTVWWGTIGMSGLLHAGTQLPKTAVARLLAELCDSISPGTKPLTS